MILFGLLVLVSTDLAVAQQGTTCDCYGYFVCPDEKQWQKEVECQFPNEVCCQLESIAPVTTERPGSLSPMLTSDSVPSDETCGKRKLNSFTWKIDVPEGVNGNTTYGEFPWMVAILKKTPSGYVFLCGGSIIAPNLILTAAHSIRGIPANDLLVKAGVWNSSDKTEETKHQNQFVRQAIIHPQFDREKIANDFALLVLKEPLNVTANAATICLSSTRKINESSCVATGWGANKYGIYAENTLKKVRLPLVNYETCSNILQKNNNFNLHNSFICAGGGVEGDTCNGDGGGPLMCALENDPDTYVQIGITSFGFGCGNGIPGAYSSVEFALQWIEDRTKEFPPISPRIKP